MKKLNLWLLLSLFVAAFTLSACGDDDDSPNNVPNSSGFTTSDLVGMWSLKLENFEMTYIFTSNKVTIKSNGEVESEGSYTLDGDNLTVTGPVQVYNSETKQYEQKVVSKTLKVGMLYDKCVLILKALADDENNQTTYEVSDVLFKDGKTPNTPSSDIQGTWDWYMHGNKDYIRTRITFDGNKFDMIITPWGQRYKGTFTYSGGYATLTFTEGYTSRTPGSGDGWGEGGLDPKTLEGTWNTLDKDKWIWTKNTIPFIASGSEAYGSFANLLGTYYKK